VERGKEMKTGEVMEKLMEYIYDEYNRDSAFKSHGQGIFPLTSGFGRVTGIYLGDAYDQREYIRLLVSKGWVCYVNKVRIKPTIAGIEHVEERRNMTKKLFKVTADLSEIAGRAVKGFLGK
jgi:hypothetical protein